MRLLFFRHGDPNYEIDGLTPKGQTEAELLAKQIRSFGIDEAFVSPLGRAKATAEYSLRELGIEARTLDWLKEIPAQFDTNVADDKTRRAYHSELKKKEDNTYEKRIVWDMLPAYYANYPELFDLTGWRESEIAKVSNVIEIYDGVIDAFDSFLKDYGYERDGSVYKVLEGNDKTNAFFCHFGITCVLLSRFWNVSPFVPLQVLAMAPTSLTEVVTEEREKGIAIFRTLRVGDITHLTMGKEIPSFSARFCEMYENEHERH